MAISTSRHPVSLRNISGRDQSRASKIDPATNSWFPRGPAHIAQAGQGHVQLEGREKRPGKVRRTHPAGRSGRSTRCLHRHPRSHATAIRSRRHHRPLEPRIVKMCETAARQRTKFGRQLMLSNASNRSDLHKVRSRREETNTTISSARTDFRSRLATPDTRTGRSSLKARKTSSRHCSSK